MSKIQMRSNVDNFNHINALSNFLVSPAHLALACKGEATIIQKSSNAPVPGSTNLTKRG
ncbi:MAG: hypothetical protein WEB87_01305 [Bacteriovoracaceae bacterium]